jgi:hypothetical protein
MSAICTSTNPPPTTQPDVAAITGFVELDTQSGNGAPHVGGKISHVGADTEIRFFGSSQHRDTVVAVAKSPPGFA